MERIDFCSRKAKFLFLLRLLVFYLYAQQNPFCYLATAVSVMESPLTVPALAGSMELLMRMLVLVKQDVKQIFCMPCITISIPHSAVCLQYKKKG